VCISVIVPVVGHGASSRVFQRTSPSFVVETVVAVSVPLQGQPLMLLILGGCPHHMQCYMHVIYVHMQCYMHVIYVHMQCYTYACYICPHAVLYACYICPHAVLHACYMSTCSVICMLYVHIQCYMSASSVIYTPVCLLYCEPQTHRLLVPPEQYAMYTRPAFIL
jgi:hypothetical protein